MLEIIVLGLVLDSPPLSLFPDLQRDGHVLLPACHLQNKDDQEQDEVLAIATQYRHPPIEIWDRVLQL